MTARRATPARAASAVILTVGLLLSLGSCQEIPQSPTGSPSPTVSEGAGALGPSPSKSGSGSRLQLGGVTQYQTISGIGVNANVHSWKDGQLKPAIDRYTGLGPLVWRVIIDRGDWERTQLPGSPTDVDWNAYGKIYSTGKMADLWNTIRYISASPGQTVILNVMGGVPPWMGGSRILPDKEDYWVRTMATMIAYGRNVEKLDFKLVAPMNEVDWNGIEGPQVPPDQYVRLTHKLLERLDSLGISDIRLVAPDTADPSKGLDQYLPALANDPVVTGRLAAWGVHTYSGDLAGAPKRLAAAGINKPVVVTEFSGPCPGCDNGAPNPNDASTARASAVQAQKLLDQGASGLEFYDAWDGYYEHHGSMGYWGALSYDPSAGTYSPRWTFGVLAVLAQCVTPGSIRIQAAVSGAGADGASVFADPASGKVSVLVLGSQAGGPATVTVSAPWSGGLNSTVESPVGAPDAGGATPGPSAAFEQGSLHVNAPPTSLACYTGKAS
ncbi:hypothetical protein [Sinomonas sp. ASV322]|uniref:hypothetical protein n=1 Tax=Sinomonas sp. ASV322 TaxID=3041920 RepID=UPI0027DE45AF|nr:hypothetical protein [Sinomonas sp. ASV322]MDQ4504344.1 hypothetical protein [Sinomonas sp. ASV322]